MSWDVIIAKTNGPDFTNPAEDADFVNMGLPAEVRAKLEASLPGLSWSTSTQGLARQDGLSFEVSLAGEIIPGRDGQLPRENPISERDEVHSIGVSVRGGGDPLPLLTDLCRAHQWSLSDSQEGTWINLNDPQSSWETFTEFRDSALGEPSQPARGNSSQGSDLVISLLFFGALAWLVRRYLWKS